LASRNWGKEREREHGLLYARILTYEAFGVNWMSLEVIHSISGLE